MHVVQLPECYRCPASIIVLANRLIVHNARRFPDKAPLQASRASGHGDANDVRYETFASPDEEAAFIPKDICNRVLNGSECVVLGRTAKLLGRAAAALADAGIEAYVTQRKTDFESPAIGVLTEALRLANARHDRDVLRRLCLAWEQLADTSLELDAVAASAALVGGDFHLRIARETWDALAPGGWLVMESAEREAAELAEHLGERGWSDVDVIEDLSRRPRIVEGRIPTHERN